MFLYFTLGIFCFFWSFVGVFSLLILHFSRSIGAAPESFSLSSSLIISNDFLAKKTHFLCASLPTSTKSSSCLAWEKSLPFKCVYGVPNSCLELTFWLTWDREQGCHFLLAVIFFFRLRLWKKAAILNFSSIPWQGPTFYMKKKICGWKGFSSKKLISFKKQLANLTKNIFQTCFTPFDFRNTIWNFCDYCFTLFFVWFWANLTPITMSDRRAQPLENECKHKVDKKEPPPCLVLAYLSTYFRPEHYKSHPVLKKKNPLRFL